MLGTMGRKPKVHAEHGRVIHPLLQWREKYRVSQQEIERACGVTQGMLSKIENLQRIPLRENLEKLLDYTGLPTDAFIRPKHFLREHPHFLDATRHPPTAAE